MRKLLLCSLIILSTLAIGSFAIAQINFTGTSTPPPPTKATPNKAMSAADFQSRVQTLNKKTQADLTQQATNLLKKNIVPAKPSAPTNLPPSKELPSEENTNPPITTPPPPSPTTENTPPPPPVPVETQLAPPPPPAAMPVPPLPSAQGDTYTGFQSSGSSTSAPASGNSKSSEGWNVQY